MTQPEVLEVLRVTAREAIARGDLPDFLAELERVKTEVVLAAAAAAAPSAFPPPPPADTLISVGAAAKRTGYSTWWIYKNRERLGFLVELPSGRLRVRERLLNVWIAACGPDGPRATARVKLPQRWQPRIKDLDKTALDSEISRP
jgi:hypothetical protein